MKKHEFMWKFWHRPLLRIKQKRACNESLSKIGSSARCLMPRGHKENYHRSSFYTWETFPVDIKFPGES